MGNTHLALTLGFEAVRKGFQMQYANASTLIERLVKANRENKLEQRIEALTKFRFLIINERAICHLPVMGLDPLNYPNPIPGIVK
jgi:DNA replication protein DnaC